MTREELDIELSEYAKTSSYDETCSLLSYYAEELEQQNTELQARIKELEEPKTCEGCTYEKQSNPLYFHCMSCNRAKHLNDKFHDKHEPCKG